MDGLFHGKSHENKDDEQGYPYFRKPPYELSAVHIFLLHARQLHDFVFSQWDLSILRSRKIRGPLRHGTHVRKSLHSMIVLLEIAMEWASMNLASRGYFLKNIGVYPLRIFYIAVDNGQFLVADSP